MSDDAPDQAAQSLFWQALYSQAQALAASEPLLASYYHANILNHRSFPDALAHHIGSLLASSSVSGQTLREVFASILDTDPAIVDAAVDDICAYFERDPACDSYCRPFLYFKGFTAVQAHRFAHWLWHNQRRSLALYLQHRVSLIWGVDIHPAARIGSGVMVDHATALVIGETALVGDCVSLMHNVTLGGTGCESGQRHPQIGSGVLISAGAKILGHIEIGDGVKVGAGSVVLESVPAHVTVVGVPAKIVGRPSAEQPAVSMDQRIEGA